MGRSTRKSFLETARCFQVELLLTAAWTGHITTPQLWRYITQAMVPPLTTRSSLPAKLKFERSPISGTQNPNRNNTAGVRRNDVGVGGLGIMMVGYSWFSDGAIVGLLMPTPVLPISLTLVCRSSPGEGVVIAGATVIAVGRGLSTLASAFHLADYRTTT